jgi:iron(III) transport system permease protein
MILFFSFLLFFIIGLLPILVMFFRTMTVQGSLNFDLYGAVFSSSRQWLLLKNSLILALETTAVAAVVGLPLGVLLGKTDLPFRKPLLALFSFPLLFPPYIIAVSWFHLMEKEGLISRFLSPEVIDAASAWLFGLPGCVLVLATIFMPVVLLLTVAFLGTVNPVLEEAARLVAPWHVVLMRIVFPIIRPGILLACILVFILAMGEFSVPMYLRYDAFPIESFTQFSAFYDYGAGTAAAVPLLVITLLVLLLERWFLRDKTYQLRAFSAQKRLMIPLGRMRRYLFVIVGTVCLLTSVLPLTALIYESASISTYMEAFQKAADSLGRSLGYAAIGGFFLMLLGFCLGYLIQTRSFPLWRSVDSMTILLFALPPTVIGIGMIGLWNRPETIFVYGTPLIIILGFLAQYTALTSRITVSTLSQIPPSMEEAAQVSGAKWLRRILWIVAPLNVKGLMTVGLSVIYSA